MLYRQQLSRLGLFPIDHLLCNLQAQQLADQEDVLVQQEAQREQQVLQQVIWSWFTVPKAFYNTFEHEFSPICWARSRLLFGVCIAMSARPLPGVFLDAN